MTLATPAGHEADFEARLRFELQRWTAVTPAMLHSIDEKGLLISVSDAWLAKLGYTREEVLGRRSADFLSAASREHAVRERVAGILPARPLRQRSVPAGMQGRQSDRRAAVGRSRWRGARSRPHFARGRHRCDGAEANQASTCRERGALSRISGRPVRIDFAGEPGGRVALRQPCLRHVLRQTARGHDRGKSVRAGAAGWPSRVGGAFAAHLRGPHGIQIENHVVLPNGEKRWMAWTNRAVDRRRWPHHRDPFGRPRHRGTGAGRTAPAGERNPLSVPGREFERRDRAARARRHAIICLSRLRSPVRIYVRGNAGDADG